MIDKIIVGLYLVIVLIVGLLSGRNTKNIQDFAIGRRDFSIIALVATIFASVVDGSGTLGLASEIFINGPISCFSYLGIVLSYITLAIFIAPKFGPFFGLISSGDILGKLYGKRAKIFMGFATIFESTLLTGVQILAITQITQYFFNIPAQIAAYGSSLIILLYSLRGGIRAVTTTDVFQFGILIIAIPIMAAVTLNYAGGFDNLLKIAVLNTAKNNSQIDYLKHAAIFISFAIPALFPLTIQRMLMAKSPEQVKKGFLITGILSIPFYPLIAIIALSALVIMPNVEASFVFPAIVSQVLPVGVKGFVIAGLLAVFMSSVDSDLNVASIAVTHDIITPLHKKEISEKTKLLIARLSSVAIAIMAAFAALYFDTIFGMIYFVLCVSNSAFFPGYLVGLLGLKPTPKGFWCGLIAGVSSVLFFTFAVGLFELYTGLVSIAINLSILILFHIKNKINLSNQDEEEMNLVNNKKSTSPIFNLAMIRPGYCSTFAIFTIINAICPFFLLSYNFELKTSPYLILYTISCLLSFMILFREFWWTKAQKLSPLLWYVTLVLALTGNTLLLCLDMNFKIICLIDVAVMFLLLTLLTDKKSFIFTTLAGAFIAVPLHFFAPVPSHIQIDAIANWSLLWHFVTLICCLFLFRKQDIENYQFLSSKLAHESFRSLSSLSSSAEFLKIKLPVLIEGYQTAQSMGKTNTVISQEILEELKEMPLKLELMGQRTYKTLHTLLGRIYPKSKSSNKLDWVNIFSPVFEAISDPSISKEDKKRIKVINSNYFMFFGDHSQISQAILNLIENSLHSISNKPNGFIEIWSEGNSLFIKDNGIGISNKDLPNIFDEFFSTKKTLGQGLTLCKEVMIEHFGSIHCVSKEGEFAQFELRFPKK